MNICTIMTFKQHVHKRINKLKDDVSISDCVSGGIKAARNLKRFQNSCQNRRTVFVAINAKSEKVNLHMYNN